MTISVLSQQVFKYVLFSNIGTEKRINKNLSSLEACWTKWSSLPFNKIQLINPEIEETFELKLDQ
jgi:hypothetical protein